MAKFVIIINVVFSFFAINAHAMDVDEQKTEQSLLLRVRDKISAIFNAREQFIRQSINELMFMTNKKDFVDFAEDITTLSTEYLHANCPKGDISTLKRQILNAMTSAVIGQKKLHKDIIDVIDKHVSQQSMFASLFSSMKSSGQNKGFTAEQDKDFLVYLYLYINDGKEGTQESSAQGKHRLLKEKRRDGSDIFKFEDNVNPIILYHDFMATIAEELPAPVVRFLTTHGSINNTDRNIIIAKLFSEKLAEININFSKLKSLNIDNKMFAGFKMRHFSLETYKEPAFGAQFKPDDRTAARTIIKLVEAETLGADIMLLLPQQEQASAVEKSSHKKKARKAKKKKQGNNAGKTPKVDTNIASDEKALANTDAQESPAPIISAAPNTTAEQEKLNPNNNIEAKNDGTQGSSSGQAVNSSEVSDVAYDNPEELLDYHHYNRVRKEQKYQASSSKASNSSSSSSSAVSMELHKVKLLIDDFNKDELRIYRGLLSGKDLHKTYSFNDLLKVVAGFRGKRMGDGDSHFTFDIPNFGSVYLVRAHGSGRDNRWLSGTYVRIFIKRLEDLGLISDELRAAYL
jgi:hypothetical protein